MKIRINVAKNLLGFALLGALSGCFGANNETSNIGPDGEDLTRPFTDAYIEYPGPNEKWAGPQSLVIHLSTLANQQFSEKAKLSISSSIFKAESPANSEIPPVSYNLSINSAREQIKRLSESLQDKKQSPSGCLLPVRVRLIRIDGSIVSRQGCRGQVGWPKVASEIANFLIESSVATQPAEKPKAEPSEKVSPSPAPSASPVAAVPAANPVPSASASSGVSSSWKVHTAPSDK